MSANATWFDERDGKFHHDDVVSGIGPAELGELLAYSLMDGTESSVWGLTVNYLTEMLRHTGRTGRFYDVLDETVDHAYDANTPTPGTYWGQARQLRRFARQLDNAAACLPTGNPDHAENCFCNVRELLEGDARELRQEARLLETHGRPFAHKPLARNYTVPAVKCADERIGSNAIWYQPNNDVFNFGGFVASAKKLGRIIALALMKGEEKVSIAGIDLTVNYLIEMLRWTGRHGQFRDFTDDDLFDPNVPPRTLDRRFVTSERRVW